MVSLKTKILITLAGGFIFCDKTQGQNTDIIPLVEIPAGSFYMGSNGDGENFDESPVHKVHITHPFKMGRTEITKHNMSCFDLNIISYVARITYQGMTMMQWLI